MRFSMNSFALASASLTLVEEKRRCVPLVVDEFVDVVEVGDKEATDADDDSGVDGTVPLLVAVSIFTFLNRAMSSSSLTVGTPFFSMLSSTSRATRSGLKSASGHSSKLRACKTLRLTIGRPYIIS